MIVSYSPMASSDASSGSVGFCPPRRDVDREVGAPGGCKLVPQAPGWVRARTFPVGEGFYCG